jgi:hypothetical protein
MACALLFGTLATTAASAGDPYGGFGPNGDTAKQEIGSDSDNGSLPMNDDQTLPWIQPQSGDQQDVYGSEATQQGSPDTGYDMDDEGGH